ncbi:MAG: hypothetical protein ACOZNI_09535 [Myxococcota bacterium]
MTRKQLGDGYHLKFTIGKQLWNDLFSAGLPFKVGDGQFDLLPNLRQGLKRLEVREKVRGLLEDREVPAVIVRGGEVARGVWHNRREQVYTVIKDLLRVEGDWRVEIDRDGSDFKYAEQRFGVEAHVKCVATGKVYLMRENLEFPFVIEKRIGAEAALADIQYDKDRKALVGTLKDVSVDLGENFILQLLNRGAEYLLAQQTPKVNPVPILKKEQLEEMVGPAGGPLRLKMGVEDVALDITEEELTLKVRFGFTQLQIEAAP